MAYSFQVPRQKYIDPQAKTLNTGNNLYDLQRQGPVSEGQQLAENQNTQGLKTGQWADVQSAQNATNRENALRTSNSLQATRGTFARSGVDTSPEAAARAQDQSFSAAEGQNLNGTNAVNQLQRQYRNDAISQAGKNEQGYTDRQNATTNTLGTLGNLDIANKNADINQQNANTTQYSAEGDLGYKGGQLALDTTKEDHSFGIEHGKLANDTTKLGQDYTLGSRAADTADRNASTGLLDVTNRNALGNRNATNDERKTTSDIYLGGRAADTAQQNANTNTTDVENRARAEANRLGFDYDKLSQDDRNQLLDREVKKDQFKVTSAQADRGLGQEDTKIQNQAQQAAEALGLDWAKLSQNDRQFYVDDARKKSEFTVTSGIDQQNADTSKASAEGATKLGIDKLAQDDTHFGVSSAIDKQNADTGTTNATTNATGVANDFTIKRGTLDNATKAQTYEEIKAMPDGPNKNQAFQAYYSGGNVSSTIAGNIRADGSLITTGIDPGAAKVQSKIAEYKAYMPKLDGESDTAYNARVTQKAQDFYTNADKINQGVQDTGTKALDVKASQERLSTLKPGQQPEPADIANMPAVNMEAIPPGDGTAAWLASNPTGGWTSINGTPVKVLGGQKYTQTYHANSKGGHVDTVSVEVGGTPYWRDTKGYWYNVNPVTLERNGEHQPGDGAVPSPIK